jgi:hypothetical protein
VCAQLDGQHIPPCIHSYQLPRERQYHVSNFILNLPILTCVLWIVQDSTTQHSAHHVYGGWLPQYSVADIFIITKLCTSHVQCCIWAWWLAHSWQASQFLLEIVPNDNQPSNGIECNCISCQVVYKFYVG